MIPHIVLVAAFDEVARATATNALLLDLPDAVVVQHDLAPGGELTRRIWNAAGVLECDSVTLGHGCVSCATREDLVPTLIRLQERPWRHIVVSLPLTAAPEAVTWQVVDATLEDLGLTLSELDQRAAGEAVCAQMDFADVVATLGTPDETTRAALDHLLGDRPRMVIHEIDAMELMARTHDFAAAQARVDPTGPHQHAAHDCHGVWTLVLASDRPLHPGRLYEQVELIGAGRLRSRGRTWVPSRPEMVVAWDGAGGQLCIGDAGLWGDAPRHTRLVITGIDAADRGRVERAFRDILLTDWEMGNVTDWEGNDGLDLWLGTADGDEYP
ncbi:GTP-binding protein [Arachnia propionica]|uniref:GTP-binding protein n=1 Tax=Arachnia propionica TaxID=1750 RepID=A0A3P1WQ69_9ACTN|nr:GTP-binding protein [Arachnia propionica]RRD48086.1 GTP-binding protein [Arachnia propionica]